MDYFPFQTFRRLLISKLQDEFENRARNVEGIKICASYCVLTCIGILMTLSPL